MANRFLSNININDEYTFPSNDGSAGQAIITDGSGNLSFGSAVASSADSTESVHIDVKNTSGSQILKGTPVYVTGETGNSGKIEIAPADASDSAKMPALGILESTLNDNAEGFCVQGGLLEGLATATIDGTSTTANDTVYVKAGGGLTMTKPTGSNLIQNIAKVARVHASNGSLVVSSILRTNDVPNLTTGKIWVGTANNTAESTVVHLDETNGRMGIGTTSPQKKLDVYLGTDSAVASIGGTISAGEYAGLHFGYSETGNSLYRHSAIVFERDDSAFGDARGKIHILNSPSGSASADLGDARLTILPSGNVGIGTTSPGEKLSVTGNIEINVGAASAQGLIFNENGTQTMGIKYQGGQSGNPIDIFRYQDNTTKVRFLENGNVGIGTTSPQQRLQVASPSATSVVLGASYLSTNNNNFFEVGISANDGYLNLRNSGVVTTVHIDSDNSSYFNGGNVGIGTSSPSEKLEVSGNVKMAETSATTDTDKFVVLDSGVLKYRTGAEVLADIGAQPSIVAPNAPTNLTTTIVNSTINVTFTASTTSGIDYYLVFSSVDGGDYGLISVIPPADFGATMSIIDDSFDATGTQAYRVYAVKNGVYSSPLTGSKSYSVTTPLEPTNMSVVNLNTAYYVQWDPPSANARFVTAYNVYKHEHATQGSLSRSSATLIYSGLNTSYMYQISGANNGNFHQFWVETTVA